MDDRHFARSKHRVVVKVGTSTLTHDTGRLNYHRIERLVLELSDLANQGKQIILVTSGAVGAGLAPLGLKEKPKTIREKQAVAAVGQGLLLHLYEKLFREYGQVVGQILLTRADSVDRKKFINSRNTLLTLLEMGVIPIINENDAVAIDELKIGDNDTLSAMVSSMVEAELLIILSDVEGVYTKNPQTYEDAVLIPQIDKITKRLYELSGGAGSLRGTGGMYTKIQAASIAMNAGVDMVIASGAVDGVLRRICDGEAIGTYFKAKDSRPHVKKKWIASGTKVKGTLTIDKGCRDALVNKGSSLLPVGITAVTGEFSEGDTIAIVYDDMEFAKGISNYDSKAILRIKGLKTAELPVELGNEYCHEEVIHRDNLVVLL